MQITINGIECVNALDAMDALNKHGEIDKHVLSNKNNLTVKVREDILFKFTAANIREYIARRDGANEI